MATQYQSKMTYQSVMPKATTTTYKAAAAPVPTPVQPYSYGGNAYISGYGQSVPKSSYPVASTLSGAVRLNTGQVVPTGQVLGTSSKTLGQALTSGDAIIKSAQQQNSVVAPSSGNNPSGGATATWDTGGTDGGGGNGGGSGDGGGSPPVFKYLNNDPSLGGTDNNPWAEMEKAAQSGDAAAQAQRDAYYQNLNDMYQQQLSSAGEQKANTLSELERQLQNYFSGVDKQKTQTNEDVVNSIGEAASTAQNVQRSNRNVLRGLGIINSSYAADQLAQPMNQFDTQRAQLQKWGLSQIANLDEQKRQKQAEADSQRNQIVSQFNDIMAKIQNDIRFSEREKIGAAQAAQAAYQQSLAQIESQKIAYQQQVNQVKTALLSDLVKLQLAQAPKADVSSIMGKSLAMINQMYTPQPQQGISIYGSTVPDQKKKSIYGNV